MIYIKGKDRLQSVLFPETLDQLVDQDHEVRFIDLFVESVNISEYEFKIKTKTLEGRPPITLKICWNFISMATLIQFAHHVF